MICGPGICSLRCITDFGHCDVPGPKQGGDPPPRPRVVPIATTSTSPGAPAVVRTAPTVGARHLELARPLQAIVDELVEVTKIVETIRAEREHAVRLLLDEDGALQLAKLRQQLLQEELDHHVKRVAAR